MPEREGDGASGGGGASRSRRRVADMVATVAMGSWIVLAAMPVVVVIVALS